MKNTCVLLTVLSLCSLSAFADIPVTNGVMEINVSGSDGWSGGDGSDAGNVTLALSYADAAKTTVRLTGEAQQGGQIVSISQVVPLSSLQAIDIHAVGGDGGNGQGGINGSDGSNGWDGQNGYNGNDGCPPTNGTDGTSGSNGQDGTSGSNGIAGGDGGNGGVIRLHAPADQTELLLLVHAVSEPGSGGRGGAGGIGGSGGRGGSGGTGGSGGRNTCVDDKGNSTGGPDGNPGYNGSSGSNGNSGANGYPGADGYDGRSGALTFTTDDAKNGPHDYAAPFHLIVTNIKAVDGNNDAVLEPGEPINITALTVANTGPMPSPTGQALKLLFLSNPTLTVKTAPVASITDVIPGNSSKILTFAVGKFVLQAPDDVKLIGQNSVLSTNIQINSFKIDAEGNTGIGINWPVTIKNGSGSTSGYFGTASGLSYVIQNIGTRDVGPAGEQPMEVVFDWVSKDIPGTDATVTLQDGRTFNLASEAVISDLTVKADSTLTVPVNLVVKNSKNAITANGTLQVTVKLKDYVNAGEDAVDTETTPLYYVIDLRPQAFDRVVQLKGEKIQCKFPDRLLKTLDIDSVEVKKEANSDVVQMRLTRSGFLANGTSVFINSTAFYFAPYSELLTDNSATIAVGFLNTIFAPDTATLSKDWIIQPGSCAISK